MGGGGCYQKREENEKEIFIKQMFIEIFWCALGLTPGLQNKTLDDNFEEYQVYWGRQTCEQILIF